MSSVVEWLREVLTTGASVQESSPTFTDADRPSIVKLLRENFDRHALEVAGPPLTFDAATALWAGQLVAHACWRLVSNDEKPTALVLREPTTIAAHLSADAMFRFLPAVYRRAKNRGADDPLVGELESLFRSWPLSGVLLDLDESPTTSPDFGVHSGLQLLYAERFVEHPRGSWLPPAGPGREWVERICAERGRPMPQEPVRTQENLRV